MGVQIFLAGAETPSLTKDLLANDVKHILYSFFYVYQGRKFEYFADLFGNHPDKKFILDSGAFTYLTMSRNPEKAGRLPKPEEYWKSYISFVRKYGHLCYGVAEFDIDGMVTDGQLADWREELIDACGKKAMPVWHNERGQEAWNTYVRDPRLHYLGIASSTDNIGQMQRLVAEAHRQGKIVHGFGQTKVNTVLKYVQLDTVDSTSWLSAQKFGQTFIFRHNKFITLDKADMGGKNRRRLFKSYFQQIGCNWDLIEADDVKELRKASIIAWKALAARMAGMRWANLLDKPIYNRDGTVVSKTGSVVDVENRELDANVSAKGKNRKFKVKLKSPGNLSTNDETSSDVGSNVVDGGVSKPGPKKSPKLQLKAICKDCGGTGEFIDLDGKNWGACETCKGDGKVPFKPSVVGANQKNKSVAVTETDNSEGAINRGAKVKMEPPTKKGWKTETALSDGDETESPFPPSVPQKPKRAATQNDEETLFGNRVQERGGEDTGDTIIEGDETGVRTGEGEVAETTGIPALDGTAVAITPVQRGLARDGGDASDPSDSELARMSGYDQKKALELVKLGIVPQMMCSTCFVAQQCPEYKEGFVCAFNKAFDAFPVKEVDNIEMLMETIVDRNKQRTLRAMMSEQLVSGGALDLNVTRQSTVLLQQLKDLRDLKMGTRKVSVTVEEGGKGGGILSKLFGAQNGITPALQTSNTPSVEGTTVTISTELPINPHKS